MSRNLTAEKNRHPPDCKENLSFPYWPIDVALGIVKAEACRYKCNLRAEFHMLHFKPRPRAGLTETYQATSAAVLGLLYKKTVDLTLTKRTEAAPLPQGHEDVTLSYPSAQAQVAGREAILPSCPWLPSMAQPAHRAPSCQGFPGIHLTAIA